MRVSSDNLSGGSKIALSAAFAVVAFSLLITPTASGLYMGFSPRTLDALGDWWAAPRGWIILGRTLGFAAFGASIAILAALLLVLHLPSSRTARGAVLLIACLPLLVPSSLVGVGWIMAMGRDALISNALRRVLGEATPTIYDWPLAAGATGLRYFGIAAILLAVTWRQSNDAAAAVRVFQLSFGQRTKLAVLTLAPGLVASSLVLLLLVQGDHILPGMFLIHTFGTELLIQQNALMDANAAAALALVPAVLTLLVATICLALMRRHQAPFDTDQFIARRSRARWLVMGLVVSVSLAVPLAGIALQAGSLENLSLAWLDAQSEAVRSFRLSVSGAVLTMLLAIPVATLNIARPGTRLLASVLAINLALPGSLLALGMIVIPWPRLLRDSDWPLLLAYASRFAAIGVVIMLAAWSSHSSMNRCAADVHQVAPHTRLSWITLPLRMPSVLAAGTLVALLIAAELEISVLLVPPGVTTLGVRLYTLVHTAPDSMVAALSMDVLLAVCGILVVVMVAARVARRLTRSVSQ